ncbi:peptidase family m1 domain-containing protein [Ditylenchus destructor]|uniref:Peptidase family m1 domain-containing protein n=1 Tax=Ditylenchus destructor TaxID=166010 RepID=A0AAD4R9T7_9BILA|nr:peptidase family m1 domain-containing protein [Ditylenchus destructor]
MALGTEGKPTVPIPFFIPIRYDVQIQLPTASDKDPLIPTFFGAIKVDFQLTRPLTAPSYYGRRRMVRSNEIQNGSSHEELEHPILEATTPSRFSALDGVELKFLSSNLEGFEAGSNKKLQVIDTRIQPNHVVFLVAEMVLNAGRYTLTIERFQGTITYNKGIYYRDAGGFPVLGTDLFPNFTSTVFPCLGGPLTKTTVKLTVVHPRDTVAVSNMQQQEPMQNLNENWRVSKFIQVPNVAAYMLSMAVLPSSVYERTIVSTQQPIYIWTNKIIHRPTLKQEIAKHVGQVYATLSGLLSEALPLSNLDLLVMSDYNGTHSFGLITISYEEWEGSDEAHRIALLARNFGRQWMGGMTTIGSMAEFCFQEDIVEYLVTKVVKLLVKSSRSVEQYLLANYVRLQIAETFLAPGESVVMVENADQYNIETHCGLKGTQMLESLESIAGEEALLSKIRHIIRHQRYKNFNMEHFLELLRGQIIDNIDLAQVYDFWFKSGGIPNLAVEKRGERLRLTQMNDGRQAQVEAGDWKPMPLWPLRISLRNISLPVTFMLSQALELAPLDKKLLALTNVDYEHLYRVNYDADGWEGIIKNLDVESKNPTLSARSRAQLVNDFCYFSAVGQVPDDRSEALRKDFFSLLRDHYEQFELCELYSFWCFGGFKKKINMNKYATRSYYDLIKSKVWPVLWNSKHYECGGPGAASDAANRLCQLVFGASCL